MPRLPIVSAVALLALIAETAQAQTYWQGGANAAGAAVINIPSITPGNGALRTAVLSLVLPASAKINGVPASMLVIKHEYDCAARTIRAVSGEAFDDKGKPITELPMQKTAQHVDADFANAVNLAIVCAPTPEARAHYGAPLGDDFNAILHKLRGEPAPASAPPPTDLAPPAAEPAAEPPRAGLARPPQPAPEAAPTQAPSLEPPPGAMQTPPAEQPPEPPPAKTPPPQETPADPKL